ncbi:MAG: alpha/beta-hydrolase family protein [Intrasporangium sp.]|uniref:alpha/beta hydrolase n=1 Tax=Intrasporangium sp. TaxID=1925024 RepID=UPI0026493B89|nr:alpha/beta-hydrolase family protein [Intrasporangium sp.]MDN5795142.1 alpha/beta-hydrolase family protein [Intrasporangium sp.]
MPVRIVLDHVRRTVLGLSVPGLYLGAVFFLVSWSPSLLPRTWYYQGLISGICAGAGYAIGVVGGWLVVRLARLIRLEIRVSRAAGWWFRTGWHALAAAAVVWVTVGNVRSQGRTAAYVHLSPPGPRDWLRSVVLALLILAVFILLARGLRRLTHRLAQAVGQVLPTTMASVCAVVVVVTVAAWVGDSVLFHRAMQRFATVAAQVNERPPPGVVPPASPLKSGSPQSLEAYSTLGYEGQVFVTSAPTPEQIRAATGEPALEPIRVYAGRHTNEALQQVADRVVAELGRTDAFDRSVLAVFTSTGTGWVDDWSVQSIEYLTGGDCAVASMQYSYLPSAMSIMTDRDTPSDAGRILFDKVYAALQNLPEGRRPKLVVGGESLGSYGGQAAFTDVSDMMQRAAGGVWVGTPRFTDIAARLTARRTEGSPEIVPVVDDGRHVRFVAGPENLTHDYYGRPYGSWQFPRFVYAQHPSDPIVWWDPALLATEPDWLLEPRGRDVNPDVTWIPFVTFWQLTTDMAVGHDPPDGYGHRYGAELVPAWGAVLGGDPTRDYSRIIAGVTSTVHRIA